jgi:hypothetical protein
MSHLEMFKKILLGQRNVHATKWSDDPIDYFVRKEDNGDTTVDLTSENIGFRFDSEGVFIGCFNYQE